MNEKQVRRLRKIFNYKPRYTDRKYMQIPCGKIIWTGKERHQNRSLKTGTRTECTGNRWKYLRAKDATHETK